MSLPDPYDAKSISDLSDKVDQCAKIFEGHLKSKATNKSTVNYLKEKIPIFIHVYLVLLKRGERSALSDLCSKKINDLKALADKC